MTKSNLKNKKKNLMYLNKKNKLLLILTGIIAVFVCGYILFSKDYFLIKTRTIDFKNFIADELYLKTHTKYEGATVSFCTTYRDRFWQISQTLPKNLEDNRQDKDYVEFVIIDFDPDDPELKNFIFDNFENDIKSGYLKYYQTRKMPKWDFSLAKNTAHYYATKDIVVNLDGDNYTGYRGGRFVSYSLPHDNMFLWQKDNIKKNGEYGRISMYKKDFEGLGGYDETLPAPASVQDADLLNRAYYYGMKFIHKPYYNDAIKNDKEATLKYTKSNLSYRAMNIMNFEYSWYNIYSNHIIANERIYGIRDGVVRIMNRTDEVK